MHWRIERDYRELKTASAWTTSRAAPGHRLAPRHVTLSYVVHALCTKLHRTRKPLRGLSLYGVLGELQHLLVARRNGCRTCRQPVQVTASSQNRQVSSI
ncbi:hypothetical protein ACFVG9_28550 [Saccharothrix carnea]|uniref:hypothetical protein n=1 Tax=Saccharothrix carnea TaxID=1280637 RepID=UPI00093C769A|nr:hypothetical protein [Saccharothrix sp. CB00851]OKI17785.1 hypothetical protein A6A25_40220 [Saccharothrix sp. CB00851]